MAKTIKLPTCPYCHKRISYVGSIFLKTKGEYNCPRCKCISNVVISRSAYAIASTVCIAALLIVVLYTISGAPSSFLGIACVLAPFLIFYIVPRANTKSKQTFGRNTYEKIEFVC